MPSPLEAALGYEFRDPSLLRRALTHRSVASDHQYKKSAESDNERLEFLGDSVLGFVVSEALILHQPDGAEGQLSKLKSRIVSASHLYEVAVTLSLGEHLILGRGEELSGGRQKRALLADALEALIAAIYLDGGMEPARQFIQQRILAPINETLAAGVDYSDPKSTLQELAQSLKLPPPRYSVLREAGPDHRKLFTVEVRLGKDHSAQGEGGSKKLASQNAATAILSQLMEKSASELRLDVQP